MTNSTGTSRRAALQRALGDAGTVLARIDRGHGPYKAAGWYALINGQLVYLGDHTGIAFVEIETLLAASKEHA
jgi:hypothetical protein